MYTKTQQTSAGGGAQWETKGRSVQLSTQNEKLNTIRANNRQKPQE